MQNVLVPICRKQKVWRSLLKSPDNSKQHIPYPYCILTLWQLSSEGSQPSASFHVSDFCPNHFQPGLPSIHENHSSVHASRPSTATWNPKQPPEAKKHLLTKQQQKHLSPARNLHRNTPLNPLFGTGKHNATNHSFPNSNPPEKQQYKSGKIPIIIKIPPFCG